MSPDDALRVAKETQPMTFGQRIVYFHQYSDAELTEVIAHLTRMQSHLALRRAPDPQNLRALLLFALSRVKFEMIRRQRQAADDFRERLDT